MKANAVSKEQLVQAAYHLILDESYLAYSARNVAKRAGCSTQPIYYLYDSLDELKKDVVVKVLDEMVHTMINYTQTNDPFTDYALGYLYFVSQKNQLFKLLHIENRLNVFFVNQQVYAILKQATQVSFHLSDQGSSDLLKRLWLFVQGLALQISNGQYEWHAQRHEKILKDTFKPYV